MKLIDFANTYCSSLDALIVKKLGHIVLRVDSIDLFRKYNQEYHDLEVLKLISYKRNSNGVMTLSVIVDSVIYDLQKGDCIYLDVVKTTRSNLTCKCRVYAHDHNITRDVALLCDMPYNIREDLLTFGCLGTSRPFEMALQIARALGISNKNNEDLEYFKYGMLKSDQS